MPTSSGNNQVVVVPRSGRLHNSSLDLRRLDPTEVDPIPWGPPPPAAVPLAHRGLGQRSRRLLTAQSSPCGLGRRVPAARSSRSADLVAFDPHT